MRPRSDRAVGRRDLPDRSGLHHVRGVHVHDAGKQWPRRCSTADPEQSATATAATSAPAAAATAAATAQPATPAPTPVATPIAAGT